LIAIYYILKCNEDVTIIIIIDYKYTVRNVYIFDKRTIKAYPGIQVCNRWLYLPWSQVLKILGLCYKLLPFMACTQFAYSHGSHPASGKYNILYIYLWCFYGWRVAKIVHISDDIECVLVLDNRCYRWKISTKNR